MTMDLLKKIPELQRVVRVNPIQKGGSHDEKWKAELGDGRKYFVKISNSSNATHYKTECEYIKKFHEMGVPVPLPVAFYELSEEEKCAQIFEFLDGKDGEEALPVLSKQEQYEAGKQAGQVLKMIHSLEKQNPKDSWEHYRWSKYERYIKQYEQMNLNFLPLENVNAFIHAHKHLLKNRPVVFLHDDYHPANLMFSSGKLQAVIDFGRYEWGDPYHDFYKAALFTRKISAPFAVGQVHGYFEGEPPIQFWKLYSLYAALIFVSDIVWSHKNTPNRLHQTKERLQTILADHHDFEEYAPVWYREFHI